MGPFVPYELPIDELIKPMVFYNELISASTNLGKYQVMLKKSKVNEFLLLLLLLYKKQFNRVR